MNPKEAEGKINEIYHGIEQHQYKFHEQTRIDTVDVIFRRKDKNLDPIEPSAKNFAQERVNKRMKVANSFKTLSSNKAKWITK